MKISLKNLLLCAVAAVGLSAAGSASAVSILNFSGNAVINNTSLNPATSLEMFFSADNNPDFLTVGINSTNLFSSLAVGTEFTANSPLTYQGGVFIPTPLFSLSGFSYVMTSVSVLLDSGNFLILTGMGSIIGPGGFNAPAELSITTQGPATPGSVPGTGNVTISGTLVTPADNVPEGGSTVLFMGMGLIGVETLRRRLVKAQA
ncbi:MAG: hypothetical protein EOP86_27805 [Verrucomicrobiaceae bacterium]|nr:MAG: hypothetical protein EOP86_27805 [Verrucomicrobiaceae bacterium]